MASEVMDSRPSWDVYFMNIAQVVKVRSNCSRRRVGSVLVRGTDVVSCGYNGTPKNARNCFQGGCDRCAGDAPSGTGYDACSCLHSENNAILMAARQGLSTKGTTLYVTIAPCISCVKELIQAGVERIIHGGMEVPIMVTDTQKRMIDASPLQISGLVLTNNYFSLYGKGRVIKDYRYHMEDTGKADE